MVISSPLRGNELSICTMGCGVEEEFSTSVLCRCPHIMRNLHGYGFVAVIPVYKTNSDWGLNCFEYLHLRKNGHEVSSLLAVSSSQWAITPEIIYNFILTLVKNKICGLRLPRAPYWSTKLLQSTGGWQRDGINWLALRSVKSNNGDFLLRIGWFPIKYLNNETEWTLSQPNPRLTMWKCRKPKLRPHD